MSKGGAADSPRPAPATSGSQRGRSLFRSAAAGAALSLLSALVLFLQTFEIPPAWRVDDSALLSSDTLYNHDLYLHLASGGAAGDWVASPATYFFSEFPMVALTMLVSGGDFAVATSLFAVLNFLLLVLCLYLLVRQASGTGRARALLAASGSVAVLVVVVAASDSWSGTFGATNRAFNASAFLIVCVGLSRVIAQGRANCGLTWLYLALCFAYGVSDGLLVVHVALPVLATAVLWWHAAGDGRETRLLVGAAALGVVLCMAGYLSAGFLQTEVLGFRVNITVADPVLVFASEQSGIAYGRLTPESFAFFARLVAAQWEQYVNNHMTGRNIVNTLLLLAAVPLLAWALLAGVRRAAASAPGDLARCARLVTVAMTCSLVLCCALVVLFVYPVPRYVFVGLWMPLLALAVAWACPWPAAAAGPAGKARAKGGGRRRRSRRRPGRAGRLLLSALPHARLLPAAAVLLAASVLAAKVAFFRPGAEVSGRLACSAEAVGDSGLSRGMVPYWNAREVSMFSGGEAEHFVYFLFQGIPFAYPHNGSARHTEGRADYAVVETHKPEGVASFRARFGLPSNAALCGREIFMLYSPDRLDGDALAAWF